MANGLLELIMTVLREPLVVARYGKWTQLSLGLICMAAISSPQYVWTLLTRPLTEKLGVGLAELQVTFSQYVWTLLTRPLTEKLGVG
ncbi:hypothetical protein UA70_22800, partial [Raoultella planticola]